MDGMLATPDEVVPTCAGKTSEGWKVRTHLTRRGIDITVAHGLMQLYSTQAMPAYIYSQEKERFCRLRLWSW